MAEGGFEMDSFEPPDVNTEAEVESIFSAGVVDDMSILAPPMSNPRASLVETKLDELGNFFNMDSTQKHIIVMYKDLY